MRKNYLIGISESGKEVSTASEPNSHIFITGKSGSGKSHLMCNLIFQALMFKSCVIIDMGNSFSEFQTLYANKYKIIVINAAKDKLPFGLSVSDNAAGISNILKQCLDMGEQQYNQLYAVVKEIIEKNGGYADKINLNIIYDTLAKKKNREARSAAARLLNFKESMNFDSNNTDGWKNILYGNPKLYIFQLSHLPEKLRKQTADFILAHMFAYLENFGSINNEFVLMLDEFQKFNSSKDAPITKMMTEGRKYGVGCICATQFDGYSNNKNMLSYIGQAATRIYLKPEDSGIRSIAKLLGNGAEWKEILSCMPCEKEKDGISEVRYAIVHKSDDSKAEDMMVKIFTNNDIINRMQNKNSESAVKETLMKLPDKISIYKRWNFNENKFEDKIQLLYTEGIPVQNIPEELKKTYNIDVSLGFILKKLERILLQTDKWKNRTLEEYYPLIFVDALYYKKYKNYKNGWYTRSAYLFFAINAGGYRDILSVCTGTNGEEHQMKALENLSKRGIKNISLFCIGRLCNFKDEIIKKVFPYAATVTAYQVNLSVVYNTYNFCKRTTCKAAKIISFIYKKLEIIYNASTIENAEEKFKEFKDEYQKRGYPYIEELFENKDEYQKMGYPHIKELCENSGNILTELFNYPVEIRKALIWILERTENLKCEFDVLTETRAAAYDDLLENMLSIRCQNNAENKCENDVIEKRLLDFLKEFSIS